MYERRNLIKYILVFTLVSVFFIASVGFTKPRPGTDLFGLSSYDHQPDLPGTAIYTPIDRHAPQAGSCFPGWRSGQF